jgi:glycosyltransferase involved in cell wall biosynthesis
VRHLFVTQDYAPDRGGMARRHVELAQRWPGGTMAVSTVAAMQAAAGGSPRVAVLRQPFGFREANRFSNQVKWARWLTSHASDVAVLHCGNVRPVGYAVWWAARRTRIPYLVYVNGGDLLRERAKARGWLKRASGRRIFGDAAGIVANSAWTADVARDVMRLMGVRQAPPVTVIDLGTDPRSFHPSRDTGALRARLGLANAPVILTVARLVPHKGQDVGIRAVAALARELPELRYLLVGEGHDEPRLHALAAELGVTDRVIFAGPLGDAEVAEAYATATVYLGASRLDRGVNVEGFGISFVEAGASGTPAVAGDSGGVRSAVRDGETGFVVAPEDVPAITSALRTLLTDHARRDEMGRAARSAVERYYNWDRVALETHELAERIAGMRSGGVR